MEHVVPVSADLGARALKWNTTTFMLNRSHSFRLEFALNKVRLTPTKHPLREHRKLSKVIFWLAKLPAPAPQNARTCSQSRLIRFILLPFPTFSPTFSRLPLSFNPFSFSYLLLPFFPSSTHPCCWGLWFTNWTSGSALCCHMTQIQRSRGTKLPAQCACVLWVQRQKHHKATVVLHIWSEQSRAHTAALV